MAADPEAAEPSPPETQSVAFVSDYIPRRCGIATFAASMVPAGALVSHGMCPECLDRFEMRAFEEAFQMPREADVFGEVRHG